MARPITVKISLKRVDKSLLYEGKNGKYLDIVLFKKDTPDQYGNTHVAYQSVSKEQREAGVKGAIIGDAKFPEEEQRPTQRQSTPPRNPVDKALDADDDDSIPL